MKKRLLLAICLLGSLASAQTLSTITGVIRDLGQNLVTSGKVTFTLTPSRDTVISGFGRFTPTTVSCSINQAAVGVSQAVGNGATVTISGLTGHTFLVNDVIAVSGMTNASFNGTFTITGITSTSITYTQALSATSGGGVISALRGGTSGTTAGSCQVTMNTALQPPGTYYAVALWPNNVKTSTFTFYAVNSSYDLTTIVPTPTTSPAQNYVDVFSNQTIGGNKTFTGVINFSNPIFVDLSSTQNVAGNKTLTGNDAFTLPLGINDLTIGTAYASFGDSITNCHGIITPSNCYVNQIATGKGWTNTNRGQDSTGIVDAGQMDLIVATAINTSSISTELCCVNDMRNNAGSGILGAAQQIDWQSSLEAALLWLAVPDANKIKASGAGVTYAGSWGATGPYANQLYGATTNGATASFSVYGTSVYVVSLWQVSNTSTYSVTVDGTTYPTITTSTGSYTTALGRTYGPLVSRFSGLAEKSHTVVVTCVSCSGGNPAYFFFAASGTGSAAKYGPYVFVGNTLRFTSTGYSSFGGSDTIVAQFNQRIKQVQDDLATDGMHVVMVDASGYYTPNGTNTQSDGVHPTDAGDIIIGAAFLNELTSFLEPKDRAALQVLTNINPCSINGVWIIGGCVVGATQGAIGSVQGATSGTMYLGSDGAGVQRSGGSYLWSSPGSPYLMQFGGTASAFPAFSFTATPGKITVRCADNSADCAFEAGTFNVAGSMSNAAPASGSPGFQHKRVASCTTGSTALNNCNTTVTWTTAFADGNYTAACTAEGLNAIGHVSHQGNKLGASIVVALVTDTAVAISGFIDCIAMHD